MSTLFSSLTETDKNDAVERLIADSTPRDDFFLMIVLAVFMATFGLLLGNGGVIIGSMLIAPLLSPILGIAMGVVMADRRLIVRSSVTVGKSVALTLPAAAAITLFFGRYAGLGPELNSEIVMRLKPDLISALIAVTAGVAASYAIIKPQLSASLPGVVVAASLIPPLSVTGIGLATARWTVIADSLVLFGVNVLAIIFSATVVFSLMRLSAKRPVADKAMIREDAKLKKEVEQAKKEAAEVVLTEAKGE